RVVPPEVLRHRHPHERPRSLRSAAPSTQRRRQPEDRRVRLFRLRPDRPPRLRVPIHRRRHRPVPPRPQPVLLPPLPPRHRPAPAPPQTRATGCSRRPPPPPPLPGPRRLPHPPRPHPPPPRQFHRRLDRVGVPLPTLAGCQIGPVLLPRQRRPRRGF